MPRSIGPSPIQGILFADHTTAEEAGESFVATSLPGHLLHYVLSGRVDQLCNGRRYVIQPGDVLWYHEDELVTGTALESPWTFYSINFIAPSIPPPPENARLFPEAGAYVRDGFLQVIQAWKDRDASPQTRLFRAHSGLLQILGGLNPREGDPVSFDAGAELWWKIEAEIRRDLSRPVSLRDMETWGGTSAATIARSSRTAVSLPPMRRVKQIRLSMARGLVQRSDLNLSQIAEHVGYPRLHEFSRDYRRHFGLPPSEDRRGFK